jgi:hypothetical protein
LDLQPPMQSVLITTNGGDITLCDKVGQWSATGRWFSSGTPGSSTNTTDRHDINEIILKVALNTINPNLQIYGGNETIQKSSSLKRIQNYL